MTGSVSNAGGLRADEVEVTLSVLFAGSASRILYVVQVFALSSPSSRTLRPGDQGQFALVFPPGTPAIVDARVTRIAARFPPDGGVFFFSPGVVIIGG